MVAKKTMVALKPKGGGATELFEVEHAERILRLWNCAWEVADNELEWTGNEIRRRKNKGGVEKSE